MTAFITSIFNFFSARWGANAGWNAITLWLPAALAVTAATASATAAYKLGRTPLHMEIAQLKLDRITAAKASADVQAKRMQEAQAKSDGLALALGLATQKNQLLTSEIAHALHTATDGRACLRGRALSLLDQAPGIRVAPPMPAPERAPTTDSAALASDSFTAASLGTSDRGTSSATADITPLITDTALANWIVQAGGLYETCRLRLQALIDWHTPAQASTETSTPIKTDSP